MSKNFYLLAACLMTGLALGGCNTNSGDGEATHAEHEDHANGAGHDEHGDELWWQRENVALGDCKLSLGHHGIHPHAGEPVEPAVAIVRDNQPVDDAEVHVSLVDNAGDIVAEEVATIFEPTTDTEEAHYAQGKLAVSGDAEEITIRYRVVLADGTSETYDVPVTVVHHDH